MFSYSKVNCFNSCPYKYKIKYIDKLKPIPDLSPNNALYIGTAAHTGIETRSVEKAIESYKSNYPEITNEHQLEILKLETILPKAIRDIPEGEYEHRISSDDGFVGYIDCLVPVPGEENTYDLLDFKCSNNISKYRKSGQVHVYKYYYESITGNKIRDLYYVFIPKSTEVLLEGMSLDDEEKLKSKIVESLSKEEIIFEKIPFDRKQVNWFFARKTLMDKAKSYEKHVSQLCQWCEFKKYCLTNGEDRSELMEEKDGSEPDVDGDE